MKREIFNKLLSWKANPNRKPLILDGARQVGKTWILNQFGKTKYNNVAYINCDKVAIMKTVFSDFDTKRLIRAFSAITNEVIKPAETLIILVFHLIHFYNHAGKNNHRHVAPLIEIFSL